MALILRAAVFFFFKYCSILLILFLNRMLHSTILYRHAEGNASSNTTKGHGNCETAHIMKNADNNKYQNPKGY